MHKSWGNAIEFDEAAERMGVDVMRWMFAKARPEENILFGWHAGGRGPPRAAGPVERVRVLRDLRPAGRTGRPRARQRRIAAGRPSPRSTAGSCRAAGAGRGRRGPAARRRRGRGDRALSSTFIDDLSTWYLRRSRGRMRAGADASTAARVRDAPRRPGRLSRTLAPILPFLAETLYRNLVTSVDGAARQRPPHELADGGDGGCATSRWSGDGRSPRAVDLARTLRGQAGLRTRQPLARPGWRCPVDGVALDPSCSSSSRPRSTSRSSSSSPTSSDLVERRVKPLLPKIGKRLGPAIPAVMAAAREGASSSAPTARSRWPA